MDLAFISPFAGDGTHDVSGTLDGGSIVIKAAAIVEVDGQARVRRADWRVDGELVVGERTDNDALLLEVSWQIN